ncbi:hypothetical protein FHX15_002203 [Rhizobium sp. BK650]|uniref:hypothetical protein n=1 Tax=Rhizobium sp. BK650 TaxID=2586990 RepID=UPI00160C42EB|nr:hypothetical protein [Rhizobium sp. BK650]MBB3656975.1 hypothetical protein [Rhizobium sp. BK650]
MESSRDTSPVILAVAVLAGGIFLLQQSGFFNGIFSTDILASVKAEDVLSTSDIAAMEKPVAATIDTAQTARSGS